MRSDTADLPSDSGAFVPGPRCRRMPTGPGALDGLRLAVKDLFDVAGAATTGGNPDWAASHAPAVVDAYAVARLRFAGAALVGKTVTDELAFSLEGANAHHGTPRHPLDANLLPGGSSSGSAVAVAWNEADIALGTDTGGSVRVPASFCGVAAMRPTHGRISLDGVIPFAPSYDTVGWFARDAQTLRRAGLALLAQPAKPRTQPAATTAEPPLKLCVAEDALALADAPVRDALMAWCERHGVQTRRQVFGDDGWRHWQQAYVTLQGLEIRSTLGPWIRQRQPRFGPALAPRFDAALALDAADGVGWQAWRARQAQTLRARLAPDEAWLLPAAPCTALARTVTPTQLSDFYPRALALGSVAGHAGLPQLVLPLAAADGLPVGVSFVAAAGRDEALLDLGAWLAALTR